MNKTLALAGLALLALAAPAGAEEAAPPACASSAHRAFDFWIGEWDVYRTDKDTLAGRSSIRREDGGCVITEQWASHSSPYTGRSLNLYDAASGQWRQFWVDSSGDVTDFRGEATATGMRMVAEGDVSAEEPEPHFTRMTFTRNADGTVRQLGDSSADGVTWTVRYDFTYKPRR